MDYSQLSDFEINKRVGIALGKELMPDDCQDFGLSGFPEVMLRNGDFKDYCNNSADSWPIIVDNKIKIEPMRRVRNYNEWYEEWDASVNSPHFCESHKNPLRAAMIVFLLSQDDKNA